MKFDVLLEIVGDEPVFETGLLLAGKIRPADLRRQLSRWTSTRKIFQLRRGLYALAPPFRKVKPHPFLIANRLVRASYVSAESALAHHGLIPERVPVTVSVTPTRPLRRETPLGDFDHRHVKPDLFWGSRQEDLGGGQRALVAAPEKALLDLVHLTDGGGSEDHLRSLRLQNLERLDLALLRALSSRARSGKLSRAVRVVEALAHEDLHP